MKANNLTRDEARDRSALVSDVQYVVALDLTTGDETFVSETTIRFDAARAEPVFADLVAESVTTVEVNGVAVDGEPFDGVRVHFPPLRAGANEVRVVAECRYETTGVGLHRFVDPVDGRVYLHTQMEAFDAHRVFACFDQPDIKATFEFHVNAPPEWEVCSNTPAVSEPDRTAGGWWRFAPSPRMSTYLAAVVAGPYHVERDSHNGIALAWWVRQSLKQYLDTPELFEVTKQGFDFFAEAFGYPYPWGKYDQLLVPEFNAGAMENIGAVTFSEHYVFRGKVTDAERERRAETILHEMAHMWFGDLVTMKWWDDLWLNESFATFMAVFSQAKATRWKHAWVTFADSEKTWAYRQDQLPTTHPIVADCPDVESVEVNFDGISYAKGASVLRQLVAWVGEDEFLSGVRAYIREHEYANADLASFLASLEAESGRDLNAWAAEWLQQAGVNTLRPVFEVRDGTYSSFDIVQEASAEFPTLRRHRIAVGLYDSTDEGLFRRRRIELDVSGARTNVTELVGEQPPDVLLLNDDDLTFAKIRLDESSLRALDRGLAEIRDPLARALCWTSCWDMVRDGELPARRWLDLVLANIHGEDRLTVIRSLQAKASSAVQTYGDPANAEAALERLAAHALAAARAAEPGSDVQLAWARTFIANATSSAQLASVRSLLDGGDDITGLAVDTEVRWLIVRSLAASGAAGDDLIDAELERDPTDLGQRRAASARAARPAAAAKADAWHAVTEDDRLHFATVRAVMEGFQQHSQRELLEPYAEKYFAVLQQIWETREIKVALEFAEAMYPHVCIGPAVVEMTDRYLASEEVPGPVRRFLLEGRDGMLRAMRARERDAAAG